MYVSSHKQIVLSKHIAKGTAWKLFNQGITVTLFLQDLWYISTRYINNIWLLLELSMGRGERSATLGMGLGHTIEKPEIL
jgi:hypothetical protein